MRKCITLQLGLLLVASICSAGVQEDTARRLIQTTGEAERAVQSLKKYLLESLSEKPGGALKKSAIDEVQSLQPRDFEDVLIPIYVKHFTQEELVELTEFAKTPLGRKVFKKQAALFWEGREAVILLGKQLSLRAANKVIESHGEDAVRKEMEMAH